MEIRRKTLTTFPVTANKIFLFGSNLRENYNFLLKLNRRLLVIMLIYVLL